MLLRKQLDTFVDVFYSSPKFDHIDDVITGSVIKTTLRVSRTKPSTQKRALLSHDPSEQPRFRYTRHGNTHPVFSVSLKGFGVVLLTGSNIFMDYNSAGVSFFGNGRTKASTDVEFSQSSILYSKTGLPMEVSDAVNVGYRLSLKS